jgi:KDO2-lipid IV(A) lauroyltransferase
MAIFPYLPTRLLEGFIDFSGKVTFLVLRRYRKRMEQTLLGITGAEFGGEQQKKDLLRRVWRNFGRSAYETIRAVHISRDEIRAMVAIEGEEHLRLALQKGKGVIALSAHLGNFSMIGPRLAAAGYPFNALVKQPSDPRFARLNDDYRSRAGVKTIPAKPRRNSVQRILAALRQNEIVLIIADEFKGGGINVEFLGQTAPSPRGPVTLALRTGAPIVPMFVTRDNQDRLTLTIFPELELVKTGDRKSATAASLALVSRHLEAMVRRYPDQWTWLGFRENGTRPTEDSHRFEPPPVQQESGRPAQRLGAPNRH